MSNTTYSQEQIEQKRLLALKRRAEKESKSQNAGTSNSFSNVSATASKYQRSGSSNSFFNASATQPKNQHNGSNDSSLSNNRTIGQNFGGHNGKTQDLQKYKYNKSSPTVMRTAKSDNRQSPLKAQNFFGTNSAVTGKCAIISESRFVVEVDYHQQLIETFKTIPSKLYDQKTRRWNFHLDEYHKLITACQPLKPQVIIAPIPGYVLQTLTANLNKKPTADIDWSRIDEKLRETLMPFQREGICYGISRKGRCLIADDMGLGKTVQALALAHYYREDWPLLIIAPSSVRYQWSEAIYQFLPSVPIHYVYQFNSGKDFVGNSKITIVSYDLLVRSIDLFERRTFGFVIMDESHCVKNCKAARTKAVQRITAHARRVVLLSGTPALSRPIELYSQISLIVPTFMGYYEYGQRYCAGVKNTFGWDFSGSSNMLELQLLLKAICMIRRLKTDVLKQLPSKIRQVVILDPVLVKRSKAALAVAKKLSNESLNGTERHRATLEYYNESSELRIKAVCSYISDLLEKGQKFILFAHHQSVLDQIGELLDSKGVKFMRIDGKTSSEQRKHCVDRFQESDDCRVAILSITAANSGITLTAAQLVVFAELFWNPGILCQAEDRVHRIGQAFGVVIQYLVARETVDDHLWPLINKKIGVLNKVGLDQNFCLNQADVTEHKDTMEESTLPKSDQMTMDSFVTSIQPEQQQNAAQTSTEISDFPDDIDLEGIDLENIE